SWHNLFYCRWFYNEYKKESENEGINVNDDVIVFLYKRNFNCCRFYRYITEQIINHPCEDYLAHIYHCLKRVRQGVILSSLSYKPENPNIAVMLEKWLIEEIKYFRAARQLSLSFNHNPPPDNLKKTTAVNKIFLNIPSLYTYAYTDSRVNDNCFGSNIGQTSRDIY